MSIELFSGKSPFDSIQQFRADRSEFWSARDLQSMMGYSTWERFQTAINRAQLAGANSGLEIADHFRATAKTPTGGGPAKQDLELSRYAAYLVSLNGDPSKPESAAAQSYFVIRTREAETAPTLDPSTPAGILVMAEQFAATARQLVLESEARKQLEAAVERQAPLVAKAEAHSASTKSIHRQEFAREVQAWGKKIHGIRILQAHVIAFLAYKGMTIGGTRSDSGHATAHAVELGWAWTDKGEAENGHSYATTKLEPKGQDIAWKWITKYVDEHNTLELPRAIGAAA